uniref:Uncharacterized protein n=1 Tax=Nelumbo nucifera TaxID=4432 RepID=A0A822Y8U2_NELNU|nr:TPA_asm: hypothetical protein HUJ06_030388 [Nelumbo nucifera]
MIVPMGTNTDLNPRIYNTPLRAFEVGKSMTVKRGREPFVELQEASATQTKAKKVGDRR